MQSGEEMREFVCPCCDIVLTRKRQTGRVFWVCESCGGRSSTVSLMRKSVPRHIVNDIWQGVRNVDYPEIRKCSCCPGMMEQIPVTLPSGQVLLDVCSRCQFVWFDAGEYAQLPQIKVARSPEQDLPPEAREKMALWKVRELEELARAESSTDGPEEFWQYIPAFLGMPVEVDPDAHSANAWVTWIMAAVIAGVGAITFRDLPPVVDAYGLIPIEAWRMGGLTFITSFFLHGGVVHLASNLYFFMAFGDNVEGAIGKWRFLLLVFLATFVGGLFHVMGDARSAIPCIGASGGISGILAFYAIAFPRARLCIFLWWFYRASWGRLPAIVFFTFWIVLQVLGAREQLAGLGSVSYLAHLGGVAVGIVFGLVWRVSRVGENV